MTDLIYCPNQLKGKHLFDGTPCPTKEVHELIGEDGVELIHQSMAEMLELRKKMFGIKFIDWYGFHDRQLFAELDSNTEILLTEYNLDKIPQNVLNTIQFPERLKCDKPYILSKFSNRATPYKRRSKQVEFIQSIPQRKRPREMVKEAMELLKERGIL